MVRVGSTDTRDVRRCVMVRVGSTYTRYVCRVWYGQGRGQLLTQGMCVGVLWSG